MAFTEKIHLNLTARYSRYGSEVYKKKEKITADFTFQRYAVGCRRTFGELGCMCHTFALMTQNKTEICLQPKK